jgi:SAM-dependent methyltransferase
MQISNNLVDQLCNKTDDQWLDMLLRSLEDTVIDDISLPAFPDEKLQRITNSQCGSETMIDAFSFYMLTKQLAQKHGNPVGKISRILDYGCGWGRIYRCFLREVPITGLFGVDVQHALVEACKNSFLPEQFKLIKSNAELPYDDETFDLVFANSVFSHLSKDLHQHAIREISRVTKCNGLIICTMISDTFLAKLTHGNDSYKDWFVSIFGDLDITIAKTRKDGFVWGSTGRKGTLSEYGLAIITDQWIHEHWSEKLDILEIIHESYSQCIVIACKQTQINNHLMI